MEKPKFGVITIAVGKQKYIEQAKILSRSLRRNMPGVPFAVITDSDQLRPFADFIVPVDRSLPIATAQKLLLDRYSPFETTLFIDSDCIITRPFHDELAKLAAFDFTVIIERLVPADGTDEYVSDLAFALHKVGGRVYPKFNGGVYYFNKSPAAAEVFERARRYFADYQAYGIKPFDRGGPGDETVIALALSSMNVTEFYDDGGQLMRTPTGYSGAFFIDPLGGGCRFTRREGPVNPAICHFAGHYLFMPEYRLADYALRTGTAYAAIPWYVRVLMTVLSFAAKADLFVHYRIDGVRKRVRRLLNKGA